MSDHSELKRLAQTANENYPGWYSIDQLSFRAVDEAEFVVAANPSTVLALIAELEVSNNVGRAIGETLGSVVESRDALVRVVDQLKAENKRLAALLECAQGDLKQAMRIIEKNSKDAERLDWLDKRSMPVVEGQSYAQPEGELWGYDWNVAGQCSTVREAIDYAISEEG